ncbi:MAG: SMI1/KNR4 family protein [Ruminococcus sp.]|nr:SMI1/KNR4 family protein [Ruminococcus sp.]
MYIPEIPNNSLTNEINQITRLAVLLEGNIRFEFNKPATESEIEDLENYFNITLPQSYKDWLSFSNGSIIDGDYVVLFSISEIKKLQIKSFPNDYIIIGTVIGDGEVLCISKTTQKFIRCFEGEERVYDSLNDFFKRPLKSMLLNAEEILGKIEI